MPLSDSIAFVLLLSTAVLAHHPSRSLEAVLTASAVRAAAAQSHGVSSQFLQTGKGAPAAVPRTRQYDLTSKINGRIYRVFVSTPNKADPGRADPVLSVLDGNWYFAAASNNVTESSRGGSISPAVVVGIGYPTDDNDVVSTRRRFELTISPVSSDKEPSLSGGGDVFLRVLQEEVRPFVAA